MRFRILQEDRRLQKHYIRSTTASTTTFDVWLIGVHFLDNSALGPDNYVLRSIIALHTTDALERNSCNLRVRLNLQFESTEDITQCI